MEPGTYYGLDPKGRRLVWGYHNKTILEASFKKQAKPGFPAASPWTLKAEAEHEQEQTSQKNKDKVVDSEGFTLVGQHGGGGSGAAFNILKEERAETTLKKVEEAVEEAHNLTVSELLDTVSSVPNVENLTALIEHQPTQAVATAAASHVEQASTLSSELSPDINVDIGAGEGAPGLAEPAVDNPLNISVPTVDIAAGNSVQSDMSMDDGSTVVSADTASSSEKKNDITTDSGGGGGRPLYPIKGRIHKMAVQLFFKSWEDPEWDYELIGSINALRPEVSEMLSTMGFMAKELPLTVQSTSETNHSTVKQEFIEICELWFCKERGMKLGRRIPAYGVTLQSLMGLAGHSGHSGQGPRVVDAGSLGPNSNDGGAQVTGLGKPLSNLSKAWNKATTIEGFPHDINISTADVIEKPIVFHNELTHPNIHINVDTGVCYDYNNNYDNYNNYY